jgi:hypothetical protein
MATKGRDLKVSFLTDLDRFETDTVAKGLEDVADASDSAGDSLDTLGRDGKKALEDLDRATKDGKGSLDEFDDAAKNTAKRVDDAFDKIAKSSKANLSKKLDDSTDDAKASMNDVSAEAQDTAREMGASFSGSVDDIKGAAQELATNAGALFGPVGLAIGVAASTGFAIFNSKKEKLKEQVSEMVDALVEGGGKLEEESIVSKLREFAQEGTLDDMAAQAAAAGVSADLYSRALAGDLDAMGKVDAQAKTLRDGIVKNNSVQGRAVEQTDAQAHALAIVRDRLHGATGATEGARTQWELLDDATRAGITADVEVKAPTARELANEAAQMKGALGKPIDVPVKIGGTRAAQLAWLEADRYFRNHPIEIRLKGTGKRPVRDVP